MNKEPICKTFSDVLAMLRKSQRRGMRIRVSSRLMPSKKILAQEKAEIKAFIKEREARRLYVKNRLLFLKQKDNKRKAEREELEKKGNMNK